MTQLRPNSRRTPTDNAFISANIYGKLCYKGRFFRKRERIDDTSHTVNMPVNSKSLYSHAGALPLRATASISNMTPNRIGDNHLLKIRLSNFQGAKFYEMKEVYDGNTNMLKEGISIEGGKHIIPLAGDYGAFYISNPSEQKERLRESLENDGYSGHFTIVRSLVKLVHKEDKLSMIRGSDNAVAKLYSRDQALSALNLRMTGATFDLINHKVKKHNRKQEGSPLSLLPERLVHEKYQGGDWAADKHLLDEDLKPYLKLVSLKELCETQGANIPRLYSISSIAYHADGTPSSIDIMMGNDVTYQSFPIDDGAYARGEVYRHKGLCTTHFKNGLTNGTLEVEEFFPYPSNFGAPEKDFRIIPTKAKIEAFKKESPSEYEAFKRAIQSPIILVGSGTGLSAKIMAEYRALCEPILQELEDNPTFKVGRIETFAGIRNLQEDGEFFEEIKEPKSRHNPNIIIPVASRPKEGSNFKKYVQDELSQNIQKLDITDYIAGKADILPPVLILCGDSRMGKDVMTLVEAHFRAEYEKYDKAQKAFSKVKSERRNIIISPQLDELPSEKSQADIKWQKYQKDYIRQSTKTSRG